MTDLKLFVPPTINPPTETLSLPRILFHLIRNPLETWPQDIYEKPSIEIRKAGRQTIFVMSGDLIQQVLNSQEDNLKTTVWTSEYWEKRSGTEYLLPNTTNGSGKGGS